jgi:hypothetical protein
MPLYEIVLRTARGDEVRVHSEPPPVSEPFPLAGRVWLTRGREPARQGRVAARFVCVELREESTRLRELATAQLSRGEP